ncbi:hypothetical protein ACFXAW_20620 [Streptomyces sp. NPDC059445]|uniref:hypothetical protein n=1 Tax=Streptomyces sp. NPDC059445 TaxID=3346832 RepID=UPI00367EBB94
MTSLPEDSDNTGPAPESTGPASESTGPGPESDADEAEKIVCAECGTTAEGPRPTWTCSVENGTRLYFCDTCARSHLRAIEGRLDSAWW